MVKNDRPHKRLRLWEKAIELVISVYTVTKGFPLEEQFGLKSQLRRAAVSIPSNLAEGLTRKSRKDKLHFFNISQASLSEVDAQFEISHRLGYLNENEYNAIEQRCSEVQMLLNGLIRSIES